MLNPIFLSNILLGGPQQTFMTAFNSCLHNTQKRLGQKASIGLDQRHDSTVNAFSSPLIASTTSCPLSSLPGDYLCWLLSLIMLA